MQYLTRQGIDLPYDKNHDDADRCYQLTVFTIPNLSLASPLHHPLATWPSWASFTRLYNSDLSVVLPNAYIFPRREYNHITAYTCTPQSNILRHHYYNTPWHARTYVSPKYAQDINCTSDSNRIYHIPHSPRLSQSPIICIKQIHFSRRHLSMHSPTHNPHFKNLSSQQTTHQIHYYRNLKTSEPSF
jgi:hypothetical protein